MRLHVIRAARELGYIPVRKNVALILPDLPKMDGYCGCLFPSLLREGQGRGYKLEITQMADIDLLSEHLLCGAISMVYHNGLERIWPRFQNLPLVCSNTLSRHIDHVFSVRSNNRQGIFLALNYLRSRGHSRIVYVGYSSEPRTAYDNTDIREREAAYSEWMPANCPAFPPLLIHGAHAESVTRALEAGTTAFLVVGEGNDLIFSHALAERGMRIPDDVSVIAYENPAVSPCLNPAQTTIGQNFPVLAAKMFDILETMIRRESVSDDPLVDYCLFERDSVRSVR